MTPPGRAYRVRYAAGAMLAVLVEEGLVDSAFIAAHTQGWEALRVQLARYTPEAVQEVCGLSARHIRNAALLFGQARNVLSLWSMGINQSTIGVQKNQAIINLHLATGQIGKPGAGPFSLTGQPNAMGGREVGGLSHLLPGYRSVLDPRHRAEVAAVWGVPPEHLSAKPGYTAVELFHALAEGRVKAVWIIGTNPAVSMPDLDLVEKGLRQAELVVVGPDEWIVLIGDEGQQLMNTLMPPNAELPRVAFRNEFRIAANKGLSYVSNLTAGPASGQRVLFVAIPIFRDASLRWVARRRGIIVPSLLADRRVDDVEFTPAMAEAVAEAVERPELEEVVELQQ